MKSNVVHQETLKSTKRHLLGWHTIYLTTSAPHLCTYLGLQRLQRPCLARGPSNPLLKISQSLRIYWCSHYSLKQSAHLWKNNRMMQVQAIGTLSRHRYIMLHSNCLFIQVLSFWQRDKTHWESQYSQQFSTICGFSCAVLYTL